METITEEEPKKPKYTEKERKFIKYEEERLLKGGKGTRIDSFRKAGYSTRGEHYHLDAYKLANRPKISEAINSFSEVLLREAPTEKVAKTIAADMFQKKNMRARIASRQQWLKATGNEGPTTLKIKTAWTRLNEFYEDEEKDKPEESSAGDRVQSIPSPRKGNQLQGR